VATQGKIESEMMILGFPENFSNWIEFLILQGTSKVIINSVADKNIVLKQGVRQGDPMSPFIFNIAIDFLARWIGQLGQLQMFKQPFHGCRLCLLYANDVLIFLQDNSQQIMLLKCVFSQFQRISGLKLNL
jgi:Reverse transcriptase (RNA-dependent DNA polymerase)